MGHDIFISYPSPNKDAADILYQALTQRGICCWMAPYSILPGTSYGASIIEGIRRARGVVLVFSSHANSSEHIRNEIERAVNYRKFIILFRVEDVLPGKELELFLHSRQWLDAFGGVEHEIPHLVEAVRRHLDQSPDAGPPAPAVAKAPARPGTRRRLVRPLAALLLAAVAMAAIWAGFIRAPSVRVDDWLKSARADLREERYEPARRTLEAAARVDPDHPDIHRLLSVALHRLNYRRESLQQAQALPPSQTAARGLIFLLNDRPDLADAEARTQPGAAAGTCDSYALPVFRCLCRNQPAEGLALADKWVAGNPKDPEGFFLRGVVRFHQGKPRDADRDFTWAIHLAPRDTKAARLYFWRAQARLSMSCPDEALADLETALALDPDDTESRVTRAILRIGRGNIAEAREDLQNLVDSGKDALNVYLTLARLEMEQQRWPELVRVATGGLRKYADGELYLLRAKGYAGLRQPDRARRDLHEAGALSITGPEYRDLQRQLGGTPRDAGDKAPETR
jgi:tetratricopeptide (TPR) repeat protein